MTGESNLRLPIDPLLPQIESHLVSGTPILLDAPPGSGKSTRVGPACVASLDRAGLPGQVVLVQPRRIAARSIAQFVAKQMGVSLGGHVGYHVRFDRRASARTRLLVTTEGMLLRRMVDDPFLEGVQCVVIDECHERSVAIDLLIGMVVRLRRTVREDLRLVLMSATLDGLALQRSIPEAVRLTGEGRPYPVEIQYHPIQFPDDQRLADVVWGTHSQRGGTTLVFLPGVGEIQRLRGRLLDRGLSNRSLQSLHGGLSLESQQRVMEEAVAGCVILSTNVAETSLTIEGVRTVVDSGWARVLRYEPRLGLDRLSLEPISQASATQRAGRAGRLGPGLCIRCWEPAVQSARPESLEPEIRRVDPSSAILSLMRWGERDLERFPWIDAPRPEALEAGRLLLERIGAIADGEMTPSGLSMADLPLPPRLAKLACESRRRGVADLGSWVAALLSERSPWAVGRFAVPGEFLGIVASQRSEIGRQGMLLMHWNGIDETFESFSRWVDAAAARWIAKISKDIRGSVDRMGWDGEEAGAGVDSGEGLERSLLAAFPDRLARRRAIGDPRAVMVGGKGVFLNESDRDLVGEFFLAIDLEAVGQDATVRSSSPVEVEWLDQAGVEVHTIAVYDPQRQSLVGRRQKRWLDLVLQETPIPVPDDPSCVDALAAAARQQWPKVLDVPSPKGHAYAARVLWLRHWMPELGLPDWNEPTWWEAIIQAACLGKRSLREVSELPWQEMLGESLTYELRRLVDREAPAKIQVPSGSWMSLEYVGIQPPVLAVRIQEIFSWTRTPRLAGGRVPLLVHLLGPNYQPQQVTEDLESFWNNTYPLVRKELKRRYPKHAWPEDPWTAQPVKKGRSSQ
ncbi:MAG: ATP-dependent helicase HrpB [Pirellulaceae bacterium]